MTTNIHRKTTTTHDRRPRLSLSLAVLLSFTALVGLWFFLTGNGARQSERRSDTVAPNDSPGHQGSERSLLQRWQRLSAVHAANGTDQPPPFSEESFGEARFLAEGPWFMSLHERLLDCARPPEGPADMREVHLELQHVPERVSVESQDRDGRPVFVHRYVVAAVESAPAPTQAPLDTRQRECLASLRGLELAMKTPFLDMPPSHHQLFATQPLPAP